MIAIPYGWKTPWDEPDPALARIAELEAENKRLREDEERVVAVWKDKRIRELEAERAAANARCDRALIREGDAIDRAVKAEAERDRLKFALDCITAGETTDPAAMARAALSDPSGE